MYVLNAKPYTMKKYALALIALLFVAACKKKDNVTPQVSDIKNLNGEWRLVKSFGGPDHLWNIPGVTDVVTTIMFKNDSSYSIYFNRILQFEDIITITDDTVKNDNYVGIVNFKTSKYSSYVKKATADSLVLQDNYTNGYLSTYVRVNSLP